MQKDQSTTSIEALIPLSQAWATTRQTRLKPLNASVTAFRNIHCGLADSNLHPSRPENFRHMQCRHCFAALTASAKFCGKCGQAVPPAAPPPAASILAGRVCPSCKTECKPASKFCGKCGHAFVSLAPLPVEPQPPAVPTDSSVVVPSPGQKTKWVLVVAGLGAAAIAAGGLAWWLMRADTSPIPLPETAANPAAVPAPAPTATAEPAPAPAAGAVPAAPAQEAQPGSAPTAAQMAPVPSPSPSPSAQQRQSAEAERAAALAQQRAQEKARRETAERERELADKAQLQKANKTLDDLLK